MIMRRPRAPILRSSADSAIASSASSVKRSFTFSYSNSFMYCRVIALRGCVRIWMSAALSSSCSVPMTGSRPTNSGMRPYLIRSDGSSCSSVAPLDLVVEADERPAADEQDVCRVDLKKFLVRVLAPALRGHIRDRALEDL